MASGRQRPHCRRHGVICMQVFTIFLAAWCCQQNVSAEPVRRKLNSTITMMNGVEIPLLGLGVGNLPHEQIENALSVGTDYKLVETSRKSNNEKLVASHLQGRSDDVQVMTKVWYTHLGYERTKISVQESLRDLEGVTQIHVLLHWPRCYSGVDWMDCEGEEAALPEHVKQAGPPPHEEAVGVFQESWRALEDMFDAEDRIVSIGISNFEPQDLTALLETARIKPHIYQGNVWIFFHHHEIRSTLYDNGIVFQAYNIMANIYNKLWDKPNSRRHLSKIALDLMTSYPDSDIGITSAQIILAWLFQNNHNIAAVVRTNNPAHIRENLVATQVPPLNQEQFQDVHDIILHVLENEDILTQEELAHRKTKEINLRFTNKIDRPVTIFWVNHETNERVSLGDTMLPGSRNSIMARFGHLFEAVDPDGKTYQYRVIGEEEKETFVIADEL